MKNDVPKSIQLLTYLLNEESSFLIEVILGYFFDLSNIGSHQSLIKHCHTVLHVMVKRSTFGLGNLNVSFHH